jgi:hypothetical protein
MLDGVLEPMFFSEGAELFTGVSPVSLTYVGFSRIWITGRRQSHIDGWEIESVDYRRCREGSRTAGLECPFQRCCCPAATCKGGQY